MLAVRKVLIGEGIPKICVPLMGSAADELENEAASLLTLQADMAEWRVDQFSEALNVNGSVTDIDAAARLISKTGARLRGILKDMPIIFTLRTGAEGGKARLSPEEYESLIGSAASSGFADLFDVELFTEKERFSEFAGELHSLNAKVIGSSHDFNTTPPEKELRERLEHMYDEGADICKIAVMPADAGDVLTLLKASLDMKREHPDTPLIAISMGEMGVISRIAGEYFGSDITFASAGTASAPGQIGVSDCRHIMEIIRREK